MRATTWFSVCVALLICSCAGWQTTALKTVDIAQRSSEALVQSAMPFITASCEAEVAKCEKVLDSECPGYHACAAIRNSVVKSFVLLQIACADAEAAIAIAKDQDVTSAVADVLRLLQELRGQLKEAGILK